MDKTQLMKDVDAAFAQHIEELRKCVRTSQELTREAPGRIASRYDTSREETGWLASGQAALLGEWERNYALFRGIGDARKDSVQIGAFFEAESLTGTFRIRCLVCQGGSGFECDTAQGKVTLVSPSSPLTAAAIGRKANDVFTVNGRVNYVIREVA